MVTITPGAEGARVAGTSFPGGFARHFRVQRYDAGAGRWQWAATSTSRDEALACFQRLLRSGAPVRLLDYSRPVTAS